MLKVAVIVLNYCGYIDTIECIDSVRLSSYGVTLIVVDNASPDNSGAALCNYLSDNEYYLQLEKNYGYAEGNNRGAKYAFEKNNDVVFILNNDTTIDKDCISRLVNTLSKNSTIGIIGPKVLSYRNNKTILSSGVDGDINKMIYRKIGCSEEDIGQFESLVPTLFQEGCGIMITKSCFTEVGGFDASLWAYWEESALCMEARLKGFGVYCDQVAKMWHKDSSTFGSCHQRKPIAIFYFTRNYYLFHRRYIVSNWIKVRFVVRSLTALPRSVLSILVYSKERKINKVATLIIATIIGLGCNKWSPKTIYKL